MENQIEINKLPREENFIHRMDSGKKKLTAKTGGIVLAIIFAGILSGFFLSSIMTNSSSTTSGMTQESGNSKAKAVVGSQDTKTFRDSAEGTLEKNGVKGEGTHRLIRPGGESQTVYLTSSVLDLDQFVGKKVRVWGETFAAKKAGWLMDVGRVEIL